MRRPSISTVLPGARPTRSAPRRAGRRRPPPGRPDGPTHTPTGTSASARCGRRARRGGRRRRRRRGCRAGGRPRAAPSRSACVDGSLHEVDEHGVEQPLTSTTSTTWSCACCGSARAPGAPASRPRATRTAAPVGSLRNARLSKESPVDPARFFAASRLVIVAGKGGVGKTTVTAALARAAALSGPVDADRRGRGQERAGGAVRAGAARLRGGRQLGRPTGQSTSGRTLTPDEALLEYLRDHGLSRISQRLVSSGALDVVATAAPGIKDILVLGKVKQLERAHSPTSSCSTRRPPATPSRSCWRRGRCSTP